MNVIALDLFDLFWSMLWFFLFFMWVYLFVALLTDIFRSQDLSGFGKALWVIGLIILPVIGALAYIIVRGDGMTERRLSLERRQQEAFRGYVQDVAAAPTPADEVAKLVELHERGVIDDQEFERQKARALA